MNLAQHIIEHAVLGITGESSGTAITGFVDYYDDLPDASEFANKLYAVKLASGSLWWAKKPGVYLSNGSSWVILDNATFQVLDNEAEFFDNTDPSKSVVLELSNITTGTKRTLTLADRDQNLNEPLVNKVVFDTSYVETAHNEGTLHWDDDEGTLELDLPGGESHLQIGQEVLFRASNDNGTDINNGQVVYISGASGNNPKVKLANAGSTNAPNVIAVATMTFSDGQKGYCTSYGLVRDIDTYFGGTAVAGNIVYLDLTDGGLTLDKLSHPYFRIKIGTILRAHQNEGVLFVNIDRDHWLKRFQAMGEPSGFNYSPTELNGDISFDDGTLTFSITPKAGQTYFSHWENGQEYRNTVADELVIDNTEGLHYIYYDTGILTEAVNPTNASIASVIIDKTIVSVIYWDATNSEAIWFADERHECKLDGETHSWMHFSFGARYRTGMALNSFSVDGNGSSNTHAQFGLEVGGLSDEDLYHTLSAVGSTVGIPILYKLGASGTWRSEIQSGFSVLKDAVSGRIYYNQYTGGAWQLTAVSSGNYVLMHVIATNNSLSKYMVMMGENEYATKKLAREGAVTEINQIRTANLPGPEYIFIATVIYRTDDGYSNDVKSIIVSTDTGDNYVDFRFHGINPSNTTSSHSNLSDLANDDHAQYLLLAGRSGGQSVSGQTTIADLVYTKTTPTTVSAMSMGDATPNVDFSLHDIFTATMPAGNKTITFSNPRTHMNAVIKVTHDSSARTLTFPTAYWAGQTGTSAVTYTLPAGATKFTHFYITYDGTSYYISDVSYWAS